MEILNKVALQEALELVQADINTCERLIGRQATPGLTKYNQDRKSTLENIHYWLRIHT